MKFYDTVDIRKQTTQQKNGFVEIVREQETSLEVCVVWLVKEF